MGCHTLVTNISSSTALKNMHLARGASVRIGGVLEHRCRGGPNSSVVVRFRVHDRVRMWVVGDHLNVFIVSQERSDRVL